MIQGNKSDLVGFLETKKISDVTNTSAVEVTVVAGAVAVHFPPIRESTSFAKYANYVFIQHACLELGRTQRMAIVWDAYLNDGTQLPTRTDRGAGTHKPVSSHAKRTRELEKPLTKQ